MRLKILLLSFCVTVSALSSSVTPVTEPMAQTTEHHKPNHQDPIVPPYRPIRSS